MHQAAITDCVAARVESADMMLKKKIERCLEAFVFFGPQANNEQNTCKN
jgi:hypothetical protein